MTPCPAGNFCPSSGLSSLDQYVCPAGSYCPAGMSHSVGCPAGFFQPTQGASSISACQACISGQYCPQASVRSTPCPAGSFYTGFNATQLSDCLQCLPNHFSPSGASLCSRCGADQTSKAGAASCDFIPCVPSAFDPAKFKCYSDLEKVTVVIGYVFSTLSSLFSVYKLRIFVRERIQKLKEANITPTLRRIIFLERTLANHSKHLLLSLADRAGTFNETRSSSDGEVVRMVRDVQRQFQEQLKQQQKQLKQQQEQLKQQQEQQRQYQEQLKQQQEQSQQQQQQIHQLMQQLQRSQQ
jgi:hypothetical protein